MKSGLQAVLRGMTGLKFVGFCYKIKQNSIGTDMHIYETAILKIKLLF